MISVTAQYLINVIERHINSSIAIRRQRIPEEFRAASATPTNEELADFILSIPYFDDGLKDFMLGNTVEQTVIVSQAWEIAFILHTRKWAAHEDWLNELVKPIPKFYLNPMSTAGEFLKLPY